MANRKRKLTSAVWEYFTPGSDRDNAECNLCRKTLQTPRGCTSTLSRHLAHVHGILLESLAKRGTVCAKLGMSCLEFVSKLAAADGVPFSTIAKSEPIRIAFNLASNSSLPSSPTAVRDTIHKFYEITKQKIMDEIEKLKSSGSKFTVSLDEWTSCSNKRYLNANIHIAENFWTVGLARIKGSFTADACLDLLKKKLDEFHISLEDITAFVSDGAAVRKRFGRISGKLHQLCFAHGIHLAVSDVIYKRNILTELDFSDDTNNENQEENEENDYESSFETSEDEITYEENLDLIISKVRKIVKYFRNSPLKNEILSGHDPGKHQLILDNKTRWNSALLMLERFHLMRDAIRKTFIDLKEELNVSEQEFYIIEDFIKVLTPVKLTVDKMCRRDSNLFTADIALKFMLEKISSCGTNLSSKLFDALKKRISERRSFLSDVASFLHFNREDLPGYQENYFEKINKPTIINHIKKLYENYSNPEDQEAEFDEDAEETQASESLVAEISLEMELNMAINEAKNYKSIRDVSMNSRDLNMRVKREVQEFQCTGHRGRILEFVYQLLIAAPPSSVEAERVFSSSSSFCTKTRSRLGDSALSELVFLRWYFNQN